MRGSTVYIYIYIYIYIILNTSDKHIHSMPACTNANTHTQGPIQRFVNGGLVYQRVGPALTGPLCTANIMTSQQRAPMPPQFYRSYGLFL